MHCIVLCLGVISCAFLGECAITAWTSPTAVAAGGNVGTILTVAEGYTGDIFTFAATSDATNTYSLVSDVPSGVFEFTTANAATGIITFIGGQVLDYEVSATHVLTIKALDNAGTAASSTVTCTIVVTNVAPSFTFKAVSVEFAVATVSGTNIATLAATELGTGSITYAITTASDSGNAFDISAAGLVTNNNAFATSQFVLIVTAADSGTTPATGTTTLSVCVPTCADSDSGAIGLAAGVMSLLTLALTMLK